MCRKLLNVHSHFIQRSPISRTSWPTSAIPAYSTSCGSTYLAPPPRGQDWTHHTSRPQHSTTDLDAMPCCCHVRQCTPPLAQHSLAEHLTIWVYPLFRGESTNDWSVTSRLISQKCPTQAVQSSDAAVHSLAVSHTPMRAPKSVLLLGAQVLEDCDLKSRGRQRASGRCKSLQNAGCVPSQTVQATLFEALARSFRDDLRV